MTEASDDFLAKAAGRWPPAPGGLALAATLAIVGGTGLAARVAMALLPAPVFAPEILPLVFLVAVLISAVVFGFWSGLLAAITGFGALNFLFTAPLYTFHVARVSDVVALVEFLLVAAFSGFLAGRLHDRAQAAQTRAEALQVLGDLSAALAEAGTADQALKAALPALARLCQGAAVVVTPHSTLPEGVTLDAATQAACDRALRSQQPLPAAAPGWEGSRLTFLPLAEAIALGHAPLSGREAPMREAAIAAMARQLRLALQRLDFAAHARAERLRAEAEATRSAVLASLGHDLRTPLATILGAASSLRELDLSAAARDDLLTAIEEEAARLNSHVSNLLQLSRLELAAAPRRAWVDLGDLATAAATRLQRAVKSADLRLSLGDLPMIQSEGGLIEQALFNLMHNALSHGRGPVTLTSLETPATLQLRIADQGPGLPAALQAWLDGPDLRPAPGQSGLGLAVAKGIARHLGGGLTWTEGALTLSLPK
jgi:two-component system sensor histidine kinase KdpD